MRSVAELVAYSLVLVAAAESVWWWVRLQGRNRPRSVTPALLAAAGSLVTVTGVVVAVAVEVWFPSLLLEIRNYLKPIIMAGVVLVVTGHRWWRRFA